MMLQALMAYAERENLGDQDFEPVKVTWQIEVTSAGKFAGSVVDLRVASANGKTPMRMTRPFTRGDDVGHGRSHFLSDSLERALLYFQKTDSQKEAARRPQFEFFKNLLREALKTCPAERTKLHAILSFLDDEPEISRARAALAQVKAKGNENLVFAVSGERILAQPEISAFWKTKRATAPANIKSSRSRATQRPKFVCMATGQPTNPVMTTRKVKGLWAGQGSGTNLIAFDKPSFASYGLKKAMNAAISPAADVKIAASLEQLIQRGLILDPRGDRKKPQPVFLHWTTKPLTGIDVFNLLDSATEADVDNLLRAPTLGMPPSKVESNLFYLMTLSANSTRIIVRDWLETTVPEVEAHVAKWFEVLEIVNPEDGIRTERAFKISRLAAALVPRKKEHGFDRPDYDKLPPQLCTQFLLSALRGSPLPQNALATAVRRQVVEHREKPGSPDPKLNPARIALIKAYLIRSPNRKETDTMTTKLDPNSKDLAYRCGQLFAVIGRLQLLALGKVGASIAERTYGGVATRPATTLGPVFTKVPAYLKKANSRFPGSGTNKQKEIEYLCATLEDLGGIPQTLGLEDQGRFALGYYCQLAHYRTDRAENEAAKKAEELPNEPT